MIYAEITIITLDFTRTKFLSAIRHACSFAFIQPTSKQIEHIIVNVSLEVLCLPSTSAYDKSSAQIGTKSKKYCGLEWVSWSWNIVDSLFYRQLHIWTAKTLWLYERFLAESFHDSWRDGLKFFEISSTGTHAMSRASPCPAMYRVTPCPAMYWNFSNI